MRGAATSMLLDGDDSFIVLISLWPFTIADSLSCAVNGVAVEHSHGHWTYGFMTAHTIPRTQGTNTHTQNQKGHRERERERERDEREKKNKIRNDKIKLRWKYDMFATNNCMQEKFELLLGYYYCNPEIHNCSPNDDDTHTAHTHIHTTGTMQTSTGVPISGWKILYGNSHPFDD